MWRKHRQAPAPFQNTDQKNNLRLPPAGHFRGRRFLFSRKKGLCSRKAHSNRKFYPSRDTVPAKAPFRLKKTPSWDFCLTLFQSPACLPPDSARFPPVQSHKEKKARECWGLSTVSSALSGQKSRFQSQ